MNREEFMRQLERLLRNIPESDRLDAIAYYNGYFDEAGEENEAQVIRELGSPEKVAETIKSNAGCYEQQQAEYTENRCYMSYDYAKQNMSEKYEANLKEKSKKRGVPHPILIVCIVCAAPILLGVGCGVLGGVLGLLGGLLGVVVAIVACGVGFLFAGVACLAVGIFRVFTSPIEGLVSIGVGSLLSAAGILLILLFVWLMFRWIPALCKILVKFFKGMFHRGERRNVA